MASRQGRKERPVDPEDGPVEAFAWRLRQLRQSSGNPTYKEMERYAQYSSSALSGAASGQAPPSLEVTLAYVRACLRHAKAGGDQVSAALAEWTALRHQLATDLTPAPEPSGPSPGPEPAGHMPVPEAADLTPVPEPADPTPAPEPSGPSPGPEPAGHTPVPEPAGPTPALAADTGAVRSADSDVPSTTPPGAVRAAVAPDGREGRRLGRPGRRTLVLVGALVLLGLGLPAAMKSVRPGSAEAGAGASGRLPGNASSARPDGESGGPVQIDALGPQSRCGPARPGAAGVLFRVCLRVESTQVLFALKVSNPGPAAAEVTTKLSYVRSGRYHSCQRSDGLWHGSVPAGSTHVTDPVGCTAARTRAAYQADGLLAPGASQNWAAHQLSPNAHVHPDQVLWRCAGDVPC
ncbi:hypothetical protein ACFCVY_18930 [Streptomyces sp. NPDC056411]|uniref:hypothetical protein n=1 Tax=Streptomyces sp. NPDC056411 TaxID=3345813 RepID=UPI0035E13CBC